MLHLIQSPVAAPNQALPIVALCAERLQVAKRRWRGVADDGVEFGFELEHPLHHGDTVFQTDAARYVLQQQSEALLEVPLDMPASAAAGLGWAVGNMHLELCSEPERLLALDEPAVRALFERLHVHFHAVTGVFRPGHFARGHQHVHELGHSHKH